MSALCFWCGLSVAVLIRDHGVLGTRGICAACDTPPAAADNLALITRQLAMAGVAGTVDLDNPDSVVGHLLEIGFEDLPTFDQAECGARAAKRVLEEPASRKIFDQVMSGAAFAFLLAIWTLVYCLVCPPAHAATGAPLTDVGLSFAAVFLPFIVAGLLVAVLVWHDRGLRMPKHEDEPSLFDAPPTAPVLASLDQQLREADGA